MIHKYLPSSKSSLYFMWVLNSGAQQRSFNETAVPGPNSTLKESEPLCVRWRGSRASGLFSLYLLVWTEKYYFKWNETIKELNSWAISQKCLDTLTDSTEQTVFSKVSSGEYLQHHHRQCSLQSGLRPLFHQNLRNRKERKSWQGSTL